MQRFKILIFSLTLLFLHGLGILLFFEWPNVVSRADAFQNPPDPMMITIQDPIRHVQSLAEWNRSTYDTQTVLFVDADGNSWTKIYRDRMMEYSRWFHEEYGHKPLFVDMSGNWIPNEDLKIDIALWDRISQLWIHHRVPTGGLKSWGGAGTIAWLDDGEIVDHEFIGRLDSLDEFKSRTNYEFVK